LGIHLLTYSQRYGKALLGQALAPGYDDLIEAQVRLTAGVVAKVNLWPEVIWRSQGTSAGHAPTAVSSTARLTSPHLTCIASGASASAFTRRSSNRSATSRRTLPGSKPNKLQQHQLVVLVCGTFCRTPHMSRHVHLNRPCSLLA